MGIVKTKLSLLLSEEVARLQDRQTGIDFKKNQLDALELIDTENIRLKIQVKNGELSSAAFTQDKIEGLWNKFQVEGIFEEDYAREFVKASRNNYSNLVFDQGAKEIEIRQLIKNDRTTIKDIDEFLSANEEDLKNVENEKIAKLISVRNKLENKYKLQDEKALRNRKLEGKKTLAEDKKCDLR